MTRRELGFSLVEILVVLVLTGLIVAGLASGARAGFGAFSREARSSREVMDGATTTRLLRGLIVRMDPGDLDDPQKVIGSRTSLGFTTELPAMPPGQRTREAEVAIGVAHGALVLRWTPRPPSPFRPTRTRETVLERGVRSVGFSYWRDGGWVGRWTWDGVPRLVRLRITRETGPEIPDLVAMPFRAMPFRAMPFGALPFGASP